MTFFHIPDNKQKVRANATDGVKSKEQTVEQAVTQNMSTDSSSSDTSSCEEEIIPDGSPIKQSVVDVIEEQLKEMCDPFTVASPKSIEGDEKNSMQASMQTMDNILNLLEDSTNSATEGDGNEHVEMEIDEIERPLIEEDSVESSTTTTAGRSSTYLIMILLMQKTVSYDSKIMSLKTRFIFCYFETSSFYSRTK